MSSQQGEHLMIDAESEIRPISWGAPPVGGRDRVTVTGLSPEVDGGRFPAKRVLGDKVVVEADVFADGHDKVSCVLMHRRVGETTWHESRMAPLVNDRWRGSFRVREMGRYEYTVTGWIDPLRTWLHDMHKRFAAHAVESVHLQMGAQLIADTAARADGDDAEQLQFWVELLRRGDDLDECESLTRSLRLLEITDRHAERRFATTYQRVLLIHVDRPKARFSTWYELFPRSCASEPGHHGTLEDCERSLPYVADMGFDVLYLPPIHPIGRINRKGKNNTLDPDPDDVGSPWAIGSEEGGHDAIHPQLGSLDDFRSLVEAAQRHNVEIAMDLAFQCAPDHPYVREHPEWFRRRPDSTIQFAENPPKQYQDIYPFDFDTEDWQPLWHELHRIVRFWIGQGVRIFRVDNPHTKAFPFWEWLIGTVQADRPDILFLAEAFTRPKVMQQLAKLGFTQSYTYFTWRNTWWELTDYLTYLTRSGVQEYLRPNFWPNTPDILPEYLQTGRRPAFVIRLLLAATLGSNYGIYGPAFELCEDRPREIGGEEYLDSEKYQLRHWDLDAEYSIKPLIRRVNRIRRENPALQTNDTLRFLEIDNEQLIAYSKCSEEQDNIILCIVNLDPYHRHGGWVHLPLADLGLPADESYQVHELLSDARYIWRGDRNYVELDPQGLSGHILRLRRRVRTEQDFDYFM